MERCALVEQDDAGQVTLVAASGDRLDEAVRLTRGCRESCLAYRLALRRSGERDLASRLESVRRGLEQAAGLAAMEAGKPVNVDVESVAFSPLDPYAGVLAAESGLEILEEALDRQRVKRLLRSRGLRLACGAVLCAVLLGVGTYFYCAGRQDGPVIDILSGANPPHVHTMGINTVTERGDGGAVWRWAYGPQTEIWFLADRAQMCFLDLSVSNLITGQVITIAVNGEPGESFDVAAGGFEKPAGTLRLPFMTQKGQNIVRIAYAEWNKKDVDFAPGDPRPLSVAFRELRIEPKR